MQMNDLAMNQSSNDSTTILFNGVRQCKKWLAAKYEEVKSYKPIATENGDKKISVKEDAAYVAGYKQALEDIALVMNKLNV